MAVQVAEPHERRVDLLYGLKLRRALNVARSWQATEQRERVEPPELGEQPEFQRRHVVQLMYEKAEQRWALGRRWRSLHA